MCYHRVFCFWLFSCFSSRCATDGDRTWDSHRAKERVKTPASADMGQTRRFVSHAVGDRRLGPRPSGRLPVYWTFLFLAVEEEEHGP